MPDNKTIEKNIAAIINSITSETSIRAYQDAPRPQGPYSTVYITSQEGVGWDSVTFENQAEPDLDLIETVKGQQNLLVSVNFFRDNARSTAKKVKLLLQSSSSAELMKASGLGLGFRSIIRNIPEVLGQKNEPRAQMDLTFNVVDSEALITRSILSVEIEGSIEMDGHISSVTINVEE